MEESIIKRVRVWEGAQGGGVISSFLESDEFNKL